MENKTYVLAISMGAIISLTFFAGVSAVFASSSTYNCTLASGGTCGKSYSAYSLNTYINSNSNSATICAGYQLSGQSPTCANIVTGGGDDYTGSQQVSISSYYHNVNGPSTTISVTDTYCNCFSPSP